MGLATEITYAVLFLIGMAAAMWCKDGRNRAWGIILVLVLSIWFSQLAITLRIDRLEERLTTPPPAEQMGSILWGDYHRSCIDRPGYFDTTRPGVQSSDEGND